MQLHKLSILLLLSSFPAVIHTMDTAQFADEAEVNLMTVSTCNRSIKEMNKKYNEEKQQLEKSRKEALYNKRLEEIKKDQKANEEPIQPLRLRQNRVTHIAGAIAQLAFTKEYMDGIHEMNQMELLCLDKATDDQARQLDIRDFKQDLLNNSTDVFVQLNDTLGRILAPEHRTAMQKRVAADELKLKNTGFSFFGLFSRK